ncbi:hypothetical protein LTR17_005325 [Elasticomyces elasticus]|nr:hypothetical protein LTR17_005325 [Elasticomyces elasticus]
MTVDPIPSRYQRVRVLLLSWEQSDSDDENVTAQLRIMHGQLCSLRKILHRLWNFEVEEWRIPRRYAYGEMSGKLNAFVKDWNDGKTLLILYYGGHGGMDKNRHAIWKCYEEESSPKVDWTCLQAPFLTDDLKSDVLMCIDCCNAGGSTLAPTSHNASNNIVFVLAACGFDAKALLEGANTFTASLTKELVDEETLRLGRTVLYIHSAILARQKQLEGVSCVSYVLREDQSTRRVLELVRHTGGLGSAISETRICHAHEATSGPSKRNCDGAGPYLENIHGDVDAQHVSVDQFCGSPHRTASPPRHLQRLHAEDSATGGGECSDMVRTGLSVLAMLCCPWFYLFVRSRKRTRIGRRPSSSDFVNMSRAGPGVSRGFAEYTEEELNDILKVFWYPWMLKQVSTPQSFPQQWEEVVHEYGVLGRWLHSDEQLFWIMGDDVARQSVIITTIATSTLTVKVLQERAQDQVHVVFSWVPGYNSMYSTVDGILRTILCNLLSTRPELQPIARDSFFRLRTVHEALSRAGLGDFSSTLKRVLVDVLTHSYGPLTRERLLIFIDAQGVEWSDIVHATAWLLSSANGLSVKLCVSSQALSKTSAQYTELSQDCKLFVRHRTYVTSELHDLGMPIAVHDFVRGEIRQLNICNYNSVTEKLVYTILARSDGTLTGAEGVLRSVKSAIANGVSARETRTNRNALPATVKERYEEVLSTALLFASTVSETVCAYHILHCSQAEVMGRVELEIEPTVTSAGLYLALFSGENEVLDEQASPISPATELLMHERISGLLVGRTKGLFHISSDQSPEWLLVGAAGVISYTDQAAREYLDEEEVKERLLQYLPGDFDANIALLGSAVLQLKGLLAEAWKADELSELDCWAIVGQAMDYASRVQSPNKRQRDCLVCYLDKLDQVVRLQLDRHFALSPHWASFWPLGLPSHCEWQDDFVSLAIRYAIVPYVEAKIEGDPYLVVEKNGRQLLDYALFPGMVSYNTAPIVKPELVRLLLVDGAQR